MERERIRDLWRESVSKPVKEELKTCGERVRDLWRVLANLRRKR